MCKMNGKITNSLFIILVTCNFGGYCYVTKNFVSSWDFSNKQNWKDDTMPCSNSEVSLEVRPANSILIDKNVQIDSLILGYDSKFIIADDKVLSFGKNAKASCDNKQKDAIFNNKARGFWWDPESWDCESEDKIECNLATPHISRVPCDRDYVTFPDPKKSLYEVIITGKTPNVVDLRIKEDSHYMIFKLTSKFTEFAMTAHGRKIIKKFSRDSSYVYIEDGPKCSSTGCLCHSDSPKREVCKIMSKKCPEPQCQKPISINGFCCDICGSSLRISHNGTLAKREVSKLLRQTLSISSGVHGHLASLDDGFYDAIFVPSKPDSKYAEVSESFRKAFNAKLNKNNYHALLLVTSGASFLELQNKWSTSNSYLVILAVIFAVGAAAGAVYVKRYRRNDLGNFDFRRFSIRGRRESTLSTVTVSSGIGGQGVRFVNPIFNVPEAIREQDSPEDDPGLAEKETPTQRSNPLFDVGAKDKTMSLSNLKEKHEPTFEEKHIEKTSSKGDFHDTDKTIFEPISSAPTVSLFDDSTLIESSITNESNTLIEYGQSFDSSSTSSEHNPQEIEGPTYKDDSVGERDPSIQLNPFDRENIQMDNRGNTEPVEEKVEIEPLNAGMLNIFQEEKIAERPSQNELSDAEDDAD